MSYPQGTAALNADYFISLTQQINMCTSCAQLQSLVSQAFGDIQNFVTGIADQNALLAPMVNNLLTPPTTNPTSIVTWITNFITYYLTPQLVAYTTYASKLTLLAVEITELTNSITNAQARFKNCAVTIPIVSGL